MSFSSMYNVDEIPCAEILIADTPAGPKKYDSDAIKFTNITSKTKRRTIQDFTVIDVETTGLSAEKAEILEVCAIKFRDSKPVKKFHAFTAPKKSIPARITKINGITNQMVEGCPHFSLIATSLVDFIGLDNLVGHNLEFDLDFIMQHGADITAKKRKYYDTLSLAQHILKTPRKKWNEELEEYETDYDDYDVDNYKLETLCNYYRIEMPTAHRADGDSFSTGFLFMELGDERIVDDFYLPKKSASTSTFTSTSPSIGNESPYVTKAERKYNLVCSQELQSLDRETFEDYVKEFMAYHKGLTPDTDKNILDGAEEQLKLINEESNRRAVKKKGIILAVLWAIVIAIFLFAIFSK